MKLRLLALLGFLLTGLIPLSAQSQVIVHLPSGTGPSVFDSLGASVISADTARGIYLISLPSVSTGARALSSPATLPASYRTEPNQPITLPEVVTRRAPDSYFSAPSGGTLTYYYGALTWSRYADQDATDATRLQTAHRAWASGAGTIAILDTGIDLSHTTLAASLVPGYDFTRDISGGGESATLDQSTSPILEQSTSPILESQWIQLLPSPLANLFAALLPSTFATRTPNAYGHGTMAAGMAHLVAPTARLMPVKVFTNNGVSSTFHIIRGIYWAVDRGAQVISMSFSLPASSPELADAIAYANSRGVICVASAGNAGQATPVYPAGYSQVISVGSTNNQGTRSWFSNYGDSWITLAAPGEGVVTTYPGNRFASAWGTSFSAPQIAGGAALLLDINSSTTGVRDVLVRSGQTRYQQLGAGLVDFYDACRYRATGRGGQ